MAAPNITLRIEPRMGSGPIRYLVLPPATPGGTQRCQLSFQAFFTNNESRSVQIIKLRVRFEAASGVPHRDIMIKTLGADGKLVIDGLRLQPGETLAPMDFKNTDNILIEGTPPAQVLFEVHARDFDQPKNYTFDLARYEVPAGGYDWPGRAGDLARGEYWEGIGAEHCCGPQLYAHDLGVVFFDPVKLDWSPFHHMKDGNRNDEYRVWGKPVYAMADGTVHALNAAEVDDNPHPPTVPDNVQTFGNHFIIDHAGELMLYAHLQFGTRNMTLVNRGVGGAVQRGDFLGLVGNSGNSHGPHLHVHCIGKTDQSLRPIPWRRKMVARRREREPQWEGKHWQLTEDQGLPNVRSLIYPSSAAPAHPLEWSNWRTMGGALNHGVAVSSWGRDRLDVFVVGTDRALYHKWWDGTRWSDWEDLGGQLNATPAAVSWGPRRIDVFGRGIDNALYHKWFDGRWHDWQGLGGTLLGAPAVSSRRANHLDVFVQATDRSLAHLVWNGERWSEWKGLGGQLTSAPSAVSWSSQRIDVFARGTDEKLWHRCWDGDAWRDWEPRGKRLKFAPAVTSRRANHLDVFLVATDGTLQHTMWKGNEWWRWEGLGGYLTEDPAAVAWNDKRLDVFGRGGDNAAYHCYWRDR